MKIRLERILCPVDSSAFSARALGHAAALAAWYEAELTALSVLTPAPAPLAGEPQGGWPIVAGVLADSGEAALRAFVASATGSTSTCVTTTTGPVVPGILAVAASLPADLVVMGTHGQSGFDRLLLGSVTEKVLRKAPCPVLTVPRLASGDPVQVVEMKTILCAIDFSDASLRAFEYAVSLAQEAGGRLALLHVLEQFAETPQRLTEHFNVPEFRQALEQDARSSLQALVTDDARAWCEDEVVIGHGKAYAQVVRLAAERHASLIVLGVQGRGAVDRLLFGSTAEHVVREATCPVLTVR